MRKTSRPQFLPKVQYFGEVRDHLGGLRDLHQLTCESASPDAEEITANVGLKDIRGPRRLNSVADAGPELVISRAPRKRVVLVTEVLTVRSDAVSRRKRGFNRGREGIDESLIHD